MYKHGEIPELVRVDLEMCKAILALNGPRDSHVIMVGPSLINPKDCCEGGESGDWWSDRIGRGALVWTFHGPFEIGSLMYDHAEVGLSRLGNAFGRIVTECISGPDISVARFDHQLLSAVVIDLVGEWTGGHGSYLDNPSVIEDDLYEMVFPEEGATRRLKEENNA